MIRVTLESAPVVDQALGVYPNVSTTLLADFAAVEGAEQKEIRWMEKFGEWKHINQVGAWSQSGKTVWEVTVAQPGDYQIDATYAGEGRPTWRVDSSHGGYVQNNQNSSHVYHTYDMGLLSFPKAGKYTLTVSLVDGDRTKASLSDIRIKRVD